jgi:hypothetical protein
MLKVLNDYTVMDGLIDAADVISETNLICIE